MTFLRSLLWTWASWILFRFDAETAHRGTVMGLKLLHKVGGRPLLRVFSGSAGLPVPSQNSRPRVLGMEFDSRLGLAAGFDKDAELLAALPALGFGFAEIGTVTPRPQGGNERPRLFRDPVRRTVFNRMGFNGLGASVVSARLDHARHELPSTFRVGVNLGKNKDTPLDQAAQDYARAAAAFEGLADYLVINVSSPNTPGLRSLQTIEALQPIASKVLEVISAWRSSPPVLLKLAPELKGEDLARILEAGERWGIQGWVLTNTLGGTWHHRQQALVGGMSGAVLTEEARNSLIEARKLTHLPIISVGGIMDADEALRRRREGADLLQIYSGWVFGGPTFPSMLCRRLLDS